MLLRLILPLASALAAVVAAGVAIYQARLSRLTTAADILMRMEDRFDDPEFITIRENAARALRKPEVISGDDNVEQVFDFFETIGLLVHKDVLDSELAWSSFFYWTHGYFREGKSFMERQKAISPNRYREAFWLCNRLDAIERSKGPIDENEWKVFLDEEEGTVKSV